MAPVEVQQEKKKVSPFMDQKPVEDLPKPAIAKSRVPVEESNTAAFKGAKSRDPSAQTFVSPSSGAKPRAASEESTTAPFGGAKRRTQEEEDELKRKGRSPSE